MFLLLLCHAFHRVGWFLLHPSSHGVDAASQEQGDGLVMLEEKRAFVGQVFPVFMLRAGSARAQLLSFGGGGTSEGRSPTPGSQRAHLLGLSTLRTQGPNFGSYLFLILSCVLLVLVGGEGGKGTGYI